MKKFLLGSIAFFLFSISISILQTSCDKDADAAPETNNGVTNLKILLISKSDGLWTANYEGGEQTKINISMPEGFNRPSRAFISSDGEKIFFPASKGTSSPDTWESYIFSCNIDGSDIKQIMFLGKQDFNQLIGVY